MTNFSLASMSLIFLRSTANLKALTDHLEGGGGREYTHSISIGKPEARIFLLSNFKGPYSQDQQKTTRCRLITSKVTLTV
jgi:hypothetical protein